ncbi:MAG: tetraacyldisaccharide 4'-kinase, partial [Endomicrobium sp.]|nr:tetraacyldisaccharide 4'-kinase [Endomicrobium sp.]
LKPAVLTHGYCRYSKSSIILKDGAAGVSALNTGDEPLLVAKSVPQSVVIVGADRYSNVLKFKNEINPDIYVLDDGFQHWRIKRDLDIVCINASNPFGNGMLIPAGILRENPKALKRADLIIITNSDMISDAALKKLKEILFILSNKEPVVTYYGDFEYKTLDLETNFDLELLKNSDVYSLSAIGFNEGFKNSIEKSGIKVKDSVVLRDHSYYNNKMLNKTMGLYQKNSYFIITSKDAVKFQNISADIKEKIAVLFVQPKFKTGEKKWEQTVLKNLLFF